MNQLMTQVKPVFRDFDRRSSCLLAALLLIFAYLPLYPVLPFREYGLVVGAIMLAALYFIGTERRELLVVLALGVLTVACDWLLDGTGSADRVLAAIDTGASVVMDGYLIALIVRQIIRQRRVNRHALSVGISAYLLLGLLFANVHGLIEVLGPGSYDLSSMASVTPGTLNDDLYAALIYYSFGLITTPGTGGIAPLSLLARSVALIESISGQVYLVVFITWLVNAFSNAHEQQ